MTVTGQCQWADLFSRDLLRTLLQATLLQRILSTRPTDSSLTSPNQPPRRPSRRYFVPFLPSLSFFLPVYRLNLLRNGVKRKPYLLALVLILTPTALYFRGVPLTSPPEQATY